jgi:hypothetical protein
MISEAQEIHDAIDVLKRVIELVREGLARPEEKADAIERAERSGTALPTEVLRRKAEKLAKRTVWNAITPDGFVASNEVRDLEPWLALLAEGLEVLLGDGSANSKQSVRFNEGSPAGNMVALVKLLGGHVVEGVFDPYLDSSGLSHLISLKQLGVVYTPRLRCLSTNKAGPVDTTFAQNVLKELSVGGEIRVSNSKKGHRRFLLLGGEDVLIIGNSFNDFDKDEVAHIEQSKHDRALFDEIWKDAMPLDMRSTSRAGGIKKRPIIDFTRGGFAHTSGGSGRRIVASLCNLGDAPAMSTQLRVHSDGAPDEILSTEFPIPTIRSNEETPSSITIEYTGSALGTLLLSNPRIVFKATDVYGSSYESARDVVQVARASGGYEVRSGGAFKAL